MALLWEKHTRSTHYQVRSAGRTVRLYSNGVLHSQFNPAQMISGAIWDLLLLPGFCPTTSPRNVLLLGLGGGTLVHLIRHFFPAAHITCVELDAQHIAIAKRWFKIPQHNVTVVQGDAYAFLAEQTASFDWIVDDVFQHVTGDPERGVVVEDVMTLYRKALTKEGLLSLNLIHNQPKQQARRILQVGGYQHGVVFTHPLYENRILACLPNTPEHQKQPCLVRMKAALNAHELLNQTRKTCRLRYRAQWLTP